MTHYSGIILEKLLTLDILKQANILAGASGINKRVTKVNVMEVPDILEWVSDGELLLTTAFPIKDNIQLLLELIPRLKSKGVAGLGIKLGRYIPELPENVIAIADELGFPIIEIPLTVSHTDVISAILTEVINDHMNMFIKMEEFNLEVMNIMIKGGGMKEIAKKLYDSIGHPLAIYEKINDNYELICPDDLDRSSIDRIIHDFTGLKHANDTDDPEEAGNKNMDDIGGKLLERITIPIVIEKIQYGYIFIWLDNVTLTPFDNMLIESYVHIVALEFVKKLSLYNMESNYKLDFFDDLLSDNKSRQNRALEKAKTFNFRKELKHSVIVILLKDLYSIDKFTYKKANFAKECKSGIVSIINRMAKHHEENVVYVEKSDRILVLYGHDAEIDDREMKNKTIAFCEKLLFELQEGCKANQLSIGLGRSFPGVEQLWKSYEQAKLIVENISKVNNSNILHYDDLGLYRFFSFDGLQNELMEFYSATMKPLVEFDKANNSEFVKTLKCYFQHNGNMKKMSETMHMHYNTIIYRLQKIKDIIGIDIEDPEIRLNLEIALKIMDLIPI
jgi:purine catabolism regulator